MADSCSTVFSGFFTFSALVFFILSPMVDAQSSAPAPASSDGTSIDEGIAYVLMLLALVLTYLIHPLHATLLSPQF